MPSDVAFLGDVIALPFVGVMLSTMRDRQSKLDVFVHWKPENIPRKITTINKKAKPSY